jgi:hypothetical protein
VADRLCFFVDAGESVRVRRGVVFGDPDRNGDMEAATDTVDWGDGDSDGVLDLTAVPDRVALRQTGSTIMGFVNNPFSFITSKTRLSSGGTRRTLQSRDAAITP